MKFEVLNYTGNGATRTISTVEASLTPIGVIVKSAAGRHPHYRITGMTNSQRVLTTATSTTAITGLTTGGFTLGADTDVNTNAEAYIALVLFDDGNSHVKVGSYTGNGGASQSINTTLGALENVIVFQNAAATAYWHPLSVGGATDASFSLNTGVAASGYITDISTTTGTFVAGTNLNTNAVTYYYIAFATVAGVTTSVSYSGNSTDNRNLDVDSSNGGRTPQFAMISNNTTAARQSVWRAQATGGHSGDQYATWSADSFGTNRIQAFSAETIQLGDNTDVNLSSNTYHAFWTTNYTPAGGGTISSVDSPVLDGEQNNALTTSGFAGEVTTVTIEAVENGVAVIDVSASLAGSAGSYTFDMPDVSAYTSDTLGIPFDTTSWTHTITAGDGVTTDSATIVVNPASGWSVVEVASAITTEGSVFYGWTGTPADGDQVYFPTANTTSVAATGILTTDQLSGSIDMIYWDQSDYYWKPFSIIITGGGTPITETYNQADYKYQQLSAQLAATSGQLADLEYAWLYSQVLASENLADMWKMWLASKGYTTGSVQDRMKAYLIANGYSGDINSMLTRAWQDGVFFN